MTTIADINRITMDYCARTVGIRRRRGESERKFQKRIVAAILFDSLNKQDALFSRLRSKKPARFDGGKAIS